MKEVVKINTPKPETHLVPEEQAARERRDATVRPANLPGTRQPTKRRANAPTVRHTPAPTQKLSR